MGIFNRKKASKATGSNRKERSGVDGCACTIERPCVVARALRGAGENKGVTQTLRSFVNTIVVMTAQDKESFEGVIPDILRDYNITVVTPTEARKMNMSEVLRKGQTA